MQLDNQEIYMCNVLMVYRHVVQVQEKLRLDLRRKIEALDIDQTCFSLDNRSEPLCDHFLIDFVVDVFNC